LITNAKKGHTSVLFFAHGNIPFKQVSALILFLDYSSIILGYIRLNSITIPELEAGETMLRVLSKVHTECQPGGSI